MDANDLTLLILKIVVSVVVALVGKFVVPVLKIYVEQHQNSQIYDFIETAVRAAEQTIVGADKGGLRKDQVINLAEKWLNKKGIAIDYLHLEQVIEECVYLMKQEDK